MRQSRLREIKSSGRIIGGLRKGWVKGRNGVCSFMNLYSREFIQRTANTSLYTHIISLTPHDNSMRWTLFFLKRRNKTLFENVSMYVECSKEFPKKKKGTRTK